MESKRILIGVTGGIAAYKICSLIRLLKKAGHTVVVAMSQNATQFIHPNTFQALSGNPIYLDNDDISMSNNGMAHINLSRDVDVFLLAPATANIIAKITHGIADDLISTLAIARNCPLIIAPAMNVEMWNNPVNQRNIQQLKQDGITLLGPASGEQACGEFGLGRMLEAEELFDLLADSWSEKVLLHKNVLITAGATYEAIDPVRGITNISSGKMGVALARVCRQAGANVTLIHGKLSVDLPSGLNQVFAVESTQEMYQCVHQQIEEQDIFISVAAVSDYRVKNYSQYKMKKNHEIEQIIELIENPDILASVSGLDNPPFCVGFSAESNDLLEHAKEKRRKKNIPLLVANLISEAMGQENNHVFLLNDAGVEEIPLMSKTAVAQRIVQKIMQML